MAFHSLRCCTYQRCCRMSDRLFLPNTQTKFRRSSVLTSRCTLDFYSGKYHIVSMATSQETVGAVEERRARLKEISDKMANMFPQVRNVSARELQALLDNPAEKVVVVDVRLPEEAAVSMIPGNTLTLEEFEQQKEGLRDHTVVAYCTVGYRSCQFAKKLAGEAFPAANLEGSILAWTQEGYPLVRRVPHGGATSAAAQQQAQRAQQEPTNQVHVFDSKWALQGEGYHPVAFTHPYLKYATGTVRRALPSWLGGSS